MRKYQTPWWYKVSWRCRLMGHQWYKGQASWSCMRAGCNVVIAASGGHDDQR